MSPAYENVYGLCAECEQSHILSDVSYDDRHSSLGDKLKYQYECPYCDKETTHYRTHEN